MRKYNVLIMDDSLIEVLALQKIMLNYPRATLEVKYCLSIEEGILEVQKKKPHIIFLNVLFGNAIIFNFFDFFQLNDVSVVFMSSERNFAFDAFKKNAVDFILKPLKKENIILAIDKAIKLSLHAICNEATQKKDFDFLAIASLDKVDFIAMKDIVFCMSDGKYTTFLLLNGKKIVSSKNLGEYEKVLNEDFFYRVHHGYIINIKHLTSIIKKDGMYCELINKVSIPIAKRRHEDFNKFIRLKI